VSYLVSVSSVDSLANHHPSNRDGNPENLSSVWFFPNRHRQRRVGSSYCQRERPRRGICNEGVIKMSEAERFVARAGTKMKPMKQTATMLQDGWMIRLKSARRSGDLQTEVVLVVDGGGSCRQCFRQDSLALDGCGLRRAT